MKPKKDESDDLFHFFCVRQNHLRQLLRRNVGLFRLLLLVQGLEPDPSGPDAPASVPDVVGDVGLAEVEHLGAVANADVIVRLLHAGCCNGREQEGLDPVVFKQVSSSHGVNMAGLDGYAMIVAQKRPSRGH